MIAILGAGKMGEALASGLLRAGVVSPGRDRRGGAARDRAEQLRETYGIEVLHRGQGRRAGAARW